MMQTADEALRHKTLSRTRAGGLTVWERWGYVF